MLTALSPTTRQLHKMAAEILEQSGLGRFDDKTNRQDANETAQFARSLEYVFKTLIETRYIDLKADVLFPVNREVPPGAESYVSRIYDYAGSAIIGNMLADDLPTVEMVAAEQVNRIVPIINGYAYTVLDAFKAALSGMNPSILKPKIAKRTMMNKVEQICAFGDTAYGVRGALNNASVDLMTVGELNGNWLDTATGAQVLSDLHLIGNNVAVNTNGIWAADTMVFPINLWAKVTTMPFSTTVGTPVLKLFLESNPYIKNVEVWPMLNLADAQGDGGRVLAYKRDEEVIRQIVAQDFTQLPPQYRNFKIAVPCYMLHGGIDILQPAAMTYADGMGD